MAQKKKPVRKKAAPKKQAPNFLETVSKEIFIILTSCIGIFLLVSLWFGSGGVIGEGIVYFLRGLFGDVAYALPVILGYLVYVIIRYYRDKAGVKLSLSLIGMIPLCAILHYFYRLNADPLPNGVAGLFEGGAQSRGGGFFGGVVAEPCLQLFGSVGTIIFLIAILFILIVLIFEISVIGVLKTFFMRIGRWFGDVNRSFKEYDENQQGAPAPPKQRKVSQVENTMLIEPIPVKGEQKEELLEDYVWNVGEIVIRDPLADQQKQKLEGSQTMMEDVMLPRDINQPQLETEQESQQADEAAEEQIEPEIEEKEPYIFPAPDLLTEVAANYSGASVEELKTNAARLIEILSSFGVDARVTNITKGSSITRYEILPASGIKVNKITALDQDIALRLPASNVRIEVLPGSIAIEVSNDSVSAVYLRSIIEDKKFVEHPSKIAVALGKDINGDTVVVDLAKTPHMMIAGATGSGKSVCINTIITSILYKASPDDVKLVMVDPKVVELGVYNGIPHLLIPIVTDPRKAAGALCWAVQEMEDRYRLFAELGVRDLKGYNQKIELDGKKKLPQIVIIIDEFADLMMVAPGEVQDYVCRIAQKARAAGMHLVLATQRPSVDVITGVIKGNIPSRIAFAVSSQVDSRTILDGGGAEKLMGRGDMLLMMAGSQKLTRVQGAYITDEDVERLVQFVKPKEQEVDYDMHVLESIEKNAGTDNVGEVERNNEDEDELLPAAADIAFELGQISTSMIQRKLKVGYARAGRLLDLLETKHIISGYDGSNKPRTVIMSRGEYLEMQSGE